MLGVIQIRMQIQKLFERVFQCFDIGHSSWCKFAPSLCCCFFTDMCPLDPKVRFLIGVTVTHLCIVSSVIKLASTLETVSVPSLLSSHVSAAEIACADVMPPLKISPSGLRVSNSSPGAKLSPLHHFMWILYKADNMWRSCAYKVYISIKILITKNHTWFGMRCHWYRRFGSTFILRQLQFTNKSEVD